MWPVILIIGITVAAIVFFASSRFTDRFIGRIGAALTLGSLVAALFVFIFPAAQSVSAPTLTSTNSLYADGVRGDILAATDTAIIKTKVDNIWTEAASGLQPTNKYDPSGCPNLGYGLAWNMRYNGRDYINTVIAFSTTKQLEQISSGGSWFVRVCVRPGLNLTAEDAAKIQAAIMQRQSGNNTTWAYQALE